MPTLPGVSLDDEATWNETLIAPNVCCTRECVMSVLRDEEQTPPDFYLLVKRRGKRKMQRGYHLWGNLGKC